MKQIENKNNDSQIRYKQVKAELGKFELYKKNDRHGYKNSGEVQFVESFYQDFTS